MSVAPFVLSQPYYSILNDIYLPVLTRDPAEVMVACVEVVFTVVILLEHYVDQIYNKKKGDRARSMGEEQAGVYGVLANRLASQFGVDGQACLQRFMCEMQQQPINKRTMAGRLLTLLLTPQVRTKRDADILTDYMTANKLGQSGKYCDHHYGSCPIRVFRYFDGLRNATSLVRQ